MADIALFDEWLEEYDTDDPYTYGVYLPQDTSDPNDFYWLNFHQTFETMESGNMNWYENGAEMQAIFDSHTECDDPDHHIQYVSQRLLAFLHHFHTNSYFHFPLFQMFDEN